MNIQQIDSLKMYVSRASSLKQLKEKIHSLFPALDNIRLFKIKIDSTLQNFKQYLNENIKEISGDEELKEYPLEYLEHIPKAELRDLEFADSDIMVIENINDGNIFEVQKIEIKEGKCEGCNDRKFLRYFCECKDVWYCSEMCKERDKNWHKKNCKKLFKLDEDNSMSHNSKSMNGKVGLQNLGNTCFMNTSLQCMSNCYELTQYFLQDHYKNDINTDNPIGTGGVLAKAYGTLLKNIWYGDKGVYSPYEFKSAISIFQPMFSGYAQHDTQEFLNYLLDGLHEDLNRVKKKPIVEKDETNKEDEIKSKEEWIGFLRRNQSAVVDLLYGQYKSIINCPNVNCNNISTTFDPFMSLSLPLSNREFTINCYFIFHDIKILPIEIIVPFNYETGVMTLRNKVSKLMDIHPFSFVILRLDGNSNIDMMYNSTSIIKSGEGSNFIKAKPYFLYQVDPAIFNSSVCSYSNNLPLTQQERAFEKIFDTINKNKDTLSRILNSDEMEEQSETSIIPNVISYYSTINLTSNGEKRSVNIKLNNDNNYGLSSENLQVVMKNKRYDETYTSTTKKRILFPRLIYLNKNWTTKEIHHYVFKYYASFLKETIKTNPDDLFEYFFQDLETDNKNNNSKYHNTKTWPYRIQIKNLIGYSRDPCFVCKSTSCSDCLLPYDESITLNDILNLYPKGTNDMQVDNTYNYLNSKVKSYHDHQNNDFSLEIVWTEKYVEMVNQLNNFKNLEINKDKDKKNKISLYSCFKNFITTEKLNEGNEWYCSKCKSHQQAQKKMEIYKSPLILIVHLKRFTNRSKIDSLIDFPIEGLDISDFLLQKEENNIYDLFAIANHYGGLGGGHYTAAAMNYNTKQWYEFNDSSVHIVTPENLVQSSAYVLFYRKRGISSETIDKIYKKQFINYEN